MKVEVFTQLSVFYCTLLSTLIFRILSSYKLKVSLFFYNNVERFGTHITYAGLFSKVTFSEVS